jgi:hypothetical protein
MKRAAIAFMAVLVSGELGGWVALPASAVAEVDLIARLTAADFAKLSVRDASVHQDPASKALTLTFNYSEGEREVRIPVRQLGWPTDWRAWRSIQYTFVTTSVETISINFSDGKVTKAFITEPLSGIRIAGVIPFESFVQTRTMNPLLPLGYKVWLNRLFTFERVEEIVFTMRYPSQPSQLTLYNFTLRDDVPADDILDRKPLIDRYGQWIPENWPGKAHDEFRDRRQPARVPDSAAAGTRPRLVYARENCLVLHREHHAEVRRRLGEEVAGPHRRAADELGIQHRRKLVRL